MPQPHVIWLLLIPFSLFHRILNYTPDMLQADVEEAIAKAFQLWSSVTPLRFTRLYSGQADIMISFAAGCKGNLMPGNDNYLWFILTEMMKSITFFFLLFFFSSRWLLFLWWSRRNSGSCLPPQQWDRRRCPLWRRWKLDQIYYL